MKTKLARLRVGTLIIIGALLVSGLYLWTRTQSLYSTRNRGIHLMGPSHWSVKKVKIGEADTIIHVGPIVLYDLGPNTRIEWK